jgi:hypothetical protein
MPVMITRDRSVAPVTPLCRCADAPMRRCETRSHYGNRGFALLRPVIVRMSGLTLMPKVVRCFLAW